jgi:hypothetical protein
VFDCHHKQHQVHFVGRVQIVVLLEVCLAFLLDCISIGELAIYIVEELFTCVSIGINSRDKTSPQQWLNCHQTAPISLKVHSNQLLKKIIEEYLILCANKSIFEDSGALVGPQLYEVTLINKGSASCFCNSLEDFRKVSQIIDIV